MEPARLAAASNHVCGRRDIVHRGAAIVGLAAAAARFQGHGNLGSWLFLILFTMGGVFWVILTVYLRYKKQAYAWNFWVPIVLGGFFGGFGLLVFIGLAAGIH